MIFPGFELWGFRSSAQDLRFRLFVWVYLYAYV